MADRPLKEQTLTGVLDALAAGTATPGGGGAAGIAGAMAAALTAMVVRLTLDKADYEDVQGAMSDALGRAEALRGALLELAQRDVEAFEGVMRAFRLPKGTEAQAQTRAERVQAALKEATETPFEAAQRALEVLGLAVSAIEDGTRNASSDAAAAAHLAHAAGQVALLNVAANLEAMRDKTHVRSYRDQHVELSEALARRYAEALQATRDRFR